MGSGITVLCVGEGGLLCSDKEFEGVQRSLVSDLEEKFSE